MAAAQILTGPAPTAPAPAPAPAMTSAASTAGASALSAPAVSATTVPPPDEAITMTSAPIEAADAASTPADAAGADSTDDSDEFAMSDYDAESMSNATTSLNTSVLQHSYENGRRYHHYRSGRYPIPNDDEEQNRDDMKHAMMLELTDGKLFYAPIGSNPQKILDLGTGTGFWAIEVADQNPGAEVVGVDLSPIQPSWIPPNCRFIVDDVEDEWLNGDGWDLIHMRCLVPWLKHRHLLLADIYSNLKPGGWVEIQEFDGRVNCDDGTVPPDSPLARFFGLIPVAMRNFGMAFNAGEALAQPLRDAGFANVQCVVKKVPFCPWARDKTLRLVGMYCQTVMSDLLNAMAAKPFKTLKDLSDVEVELMKTAAKKQMGDPHQHAYVNYYFWYAQRV